MGSIEDGLNRIVEAITPRGLGGHGPRKVKVNLLRKLVKSLIVVVDGTLNYFSNFALYPIINFNFGREKKG